MPFYFLDYPAAAENRTTAQRQSVHANLLDVRVDISDSGSGLTQLLSLPSKSQVRHAWSLVRPSDQKTESAMDCNGCYVAVKTGGTEPSKPPLKRGHHKRVAFSRSLFCILHSPVSTPKQGNLLALIKDRRPPPVRFHYLVFIRLIHMSSNLGLYLFSFLCDLLKMYHCSSSGHV